MLVTENGWNQVNSDGTVWMKVPGSNNVTLQVHSGDAGIVLIAWAAWFNEFVEELDDPQTGCWTPTNSVWNSNHLSATAVDLNWTFHPFHAYTYDSQKIAKIRAGQELFRNCIFWGADWNSPHDEMHFQLNYPEGDERITRLANDLRNGYLGIFKPDTDTNPPANTPDLVGILSDAMGDNESRERYAELLPAVQKALKDCDCTNIERITMWFAQIGHESVGLQYMEEIADGSQYEGRTDLGNTEPGDGRKFKGRGPIQVTGRHNYSVLSQWAFGKRLVPTPSYFVDNPDELASDTYGFIGVVWYWTVARPQINSLCDANDLEGVTRAINGGLNGLRDRRERWEHCKAMGISLFQLVTETTTSGEDMANVQQEEWIEIRDKTRQIWGALFNPVPSNSRYGDPKDLWATKDFIRNDDGFMFDLITEHDASLGDPAALARIQKAANNGDLIAQHFLEKLSQSITPPVLPYSSDIAMEVVAAQEISQPPPNNFVCWNCGKHYPEELPSCPFCGASQDQPATPTPQKAPEPPSEPQKPGKHEAGQGVSATLTSESAAADGLPTIDKKVADQFLLLERFKDELPQEVSQAIDDLIPIVKGLVKGK